jgi:hypothetical protein
MYEEHRRADSRSALNYKIGPKLLVRKGGDSNPQGFPRQILSSTRTKKSIAREVRLEKCKTLRLDNNSARLYCCAVRPPRVVTAVEHCC